MAASQRPRDPLATFLDLQGFVVACVEIEERSPKPIKVVVLEDRRGFHQCPRCRKRHRDGAFQETTPRRWRDCSLGDYETYVEAIPWRVACCGGTLVERFPWENDGHRMTRRFFERVAALCTKLPVDVVRRMVNLSWDTTARIDAKAIELALGGRAPALEGLRDIGVDEVSWTGGHQYFTIVTDLRSSRVVWIGDGKYEEAFGAFFQALGKAGRRRIRVVVSDLWRGYLGAIRRWVPHARHVLDRFHIVKWVNDALVLVRRAVFGRAPATAGGRALKVKQWMLLSARENLSVGNKRLLSRLMRVNRQLYRAYLLKEQLRTILHYRWKRLDAARRNILDWCAAASRSRLKPIVNIAKNVRKHVEKVVAGFGSGVKLGVVEATNGKIGLLRRAARGYSDKEYFKLKIYQRCSLVGVNPWAWVPL